MTGLMIAPLLSIIGLAWLFIGAGCWLGWQLLRQNGRMLLRFDELEKRLDELESLAGREPVNPSLDTADSPVRDGEDRADRFSKRSLARSRIKRAGLKAGTPAPDFQLPCLHATERSLRDFRGRPVLLVFSDPHCGPCQILAPHLEKFHRAHPEIQLLMISRGEPQENRRKAKEHGLTFPIVLQQRWEIS